MTPRKAPRTSEPEPRPAPASSDAIGRASAPEGVCQTPELAAPQVCADTLPLHAFLTFKLVALANVLQTQVTRHYVAPATPLGLTEWRLMGLLHQHHELHASALVRHSVIDKAQISRTLQPLIDRGWVARRTDPEHARRHLLSLTAAGDAIFHGVLEQARPYQAALWNALSVSERASLEHTMDKLTAAAQALDAQALSPPARRLGLGRKVRSPSGGTAP